MKADKMRVEIDGVLYVPVSEASPDAAAVLRAVALRYHTEETLAVFGTDGLYVEVNEDGEGEPLADFVADIIAARSDIRPTTWKA